MSNVFVTSDTHYGHRNIIPYCNRPFSSVGEMDGFMIKSHKKTVTDNDLLIHVGDFSFHSKSSHPLYDLPGRKVLICGNHDGRAIRKASYWAEVYPTTFEHNGLIFSHYPIDIDLNKTLIHGHIHHHPSSRPNHINACVEHWNYTPVLLTTLLEKHHAQLQRSLHSPL